MCLRNCASASGSRERSSRRKYSETNRSPPVKPSAVAEPAPRPASTAPPGTSRPASPPSARSARRPRRRRARRPPLRAASRLPARPAGGLRRRSRPRILAPASGRGAGPALPCLRPRSASRPGRTGKARRARPDRPDWRQRADRRGPAPAGARVRRSRRRREGPVSTRWIRPARTTHRRRRTRRARAGASPPRCTAGTRPRRHLAHPARPRRTDESRPRPSARAGSSCRIRRARPRSRKACFAALSRAMTSAFATVPGRGNGAVSLASARSKGTSATATEEPC